MVPRFPACPSEHSACIPRGARSLGFLLGFLLVFLLLRRIVFVGAILRLMEAGVVVAEVEVEVVVEGVVEC